MHTFVYFLQSFNFTVAIASGIFEATKIAPVVNYVNKCLQESLAQ